ncbi:MAG: serine/threonine-protein kinase [Vicinamibacteria bacterium]
MPRDKTEPIERPKLPLKLAKDWSFDEAERLGPAGGFGEVFAGSSTEGEHVAVKRIKRVTAGLATSEVRIARSLMARPSAHVIPILDAGIDSLTGDHFIVMPRADESLQERLDREGPMLDEDAMAVLSDVLTGLQEMGGIVHGDLKPANVLYHDGKWKLADMGIARNLDEAPTALSARMFVSDPYAAPEQWRFEPATRATDVYGFGCLAYAVLTGNPPFPGPAQEDYCVQHLEAAPPPLSASPPVRALIQMCLTKDRASRPSINTALVLLRRAWLAK